MEVGNAKRCVEMICSCTFVRNSHQPIDLSLRWDITPHVGVLQSGRSASNPVNIVLAPAEQA